MQRLARALGPVFLVAGLALLAYAVHTGEARFLLVVIVPVFSGSTPAFFLASILLIGGVLLLPFAFLGVSGEADDEVPPRPVPAVSPPASSSGGMVLIGPVPIFLGSWRGHPPISYRWAVVLGIVLAVVAILLLWGLAVL